MNPGSPPLTRGIPKPESIKCLIGRFTPAHAGNTICTHFSMTASGVHPRSRGEYLENMNQMHERTGSPPLTRGIQNLLRTYKTEHRFTPAHAGNTNL